MKRGFTLLELIVVIIILGILATLAVTQYGRMIEMSRGAEARQILGVIRTNEAATRMRSGACTSIDSEVGIGGAGAEVPGPTGTCAGTHWFSYDVTAADANGFTAIATRCTAGGKAPQGTAPAGTVQLVTNFLTGVDTWTTTGVY